MATTTSPCDFLSVTFSRPSCVTMPVSCGLPAGVELLSIITWSSSIASSSVAANGSQPPCGQWR